MAPISQSRCVVTSTVLHVAVISAALLASAFKSPEVPPPAKDFFVTILPDAKLSAEASSGGGPPVPVPRNTPPSPAPPKAVEAPASKLPPPSSPPAPPQEAPKDPPKEIAKEPPKPREELPRTKPEKPAIRLAERPVPNPTVKPQDVDPDRAAPRPSKPVIALATKPVASSNEEIKKARQKAEEQQRQAAERAERAEAKRQERLAAEAAQARADWEQAQASRRNALQGVVQGLGQAIVGPMKIELPGPGGGGAVVVNYADYVRTVFQAAWNRNRPATLAAKSAQSRVSLIVRRDGTFTSRVLTPARIPDVDAAIGRILRQQGSLRPFPSELNKEDVEIIITFNLESSASG